MKNNIVAVTFDPQNGVSLSTLKRALASFGITVTLHPSADDDVDGFVFSKGPLDEKSLEEVRVRSANTMRLGGTKTTITQI